LLGDLSAGPALRVAAATRSCAWGVAASPVLSRARSCCLCCWLCKRFALRLRRTPRAGTHLRAAGLATTRPAGRLSPLKEANGPWEWALIGQRRCRVVGCQDGLTPGGFGAMRRALGTGNSMMDGFPLARPVPARPGPTNGALVLLAGQSPCRRPWATLHACLGHGDARASRAGRARQAETKPIARDSAATGSSPAMAGTARCLRAAGVRSPVNPPRAAEPRRLASGEVFDSGGSGAFEALAMLGGGGLAMAAPPPNNSSA